MNGSLVFTLASGIGWFFGVMVSTAILYTNNLMNTYTFEEAMGNALALAFPGIILLIIALIIAMGDNSGSSF